MVSLYFIGVDELHGKDTDTFFPHNQLHTAGVQELLMTNQYGVCV